MACTRILFVGDMHLGTHPSRVPADAGDRTALGPAGAWNRTVDAALQHEVQAVALAGDVVDGRNDLFEASGSLRPGLERLAAAGIATVAVAGNHDTRALPGLVAAGAPLTLLGPAGTWSGHTVAAPAGPDVRLCGWSFPAQRWTASPLETPPPAAVPGRVTLGLLHADLDAAGGHYAPVSAAALTATGYDGWFLGHIHTPGPVPADGRPFYLGSLCGLDPTETGSHGPVLVSVDAAGRISGERLPLAPLRWEDLELALAAEPADADDLQEMLLHGISAPLAALDLPAATVLGLRVTLAGEAAHPLAVAAAAADLSDRDLVTAVDGVTVFIDRVTSAVQARLDLNALAAGDDPPGLLARRILVLENGPHGDADRELLARLLETTRTALAAAGRLAPGVGRDDPDDHRLRALAAGQARRLLARVLDGREATP